MANHNSKSTQQPFTPVQVKPRHDGWNIQRQRQFIEILAGSGSISRAADFVGMSVSSAYALRRRHDAAEFCAAWDAAIAAATRRHADSCLDRAIHGTEIPIFYQGDMIGTKRVFSDRLAMFLFRFHDPLKYGSLSGPQPFDATGEDYFIPLIRRLPLLLNRLLRRGKVPARQPINSANAQTSQS